VDQSVEVALPAVDDDDQVDEQIAAVGVVALDGPS
jgi:hypothetical protein